MSTARRTWRASCTAAMGLACASTLVLAGCSGAGDQEPAAATASPVASEPAASQAPEKPAEPDEEPAATASAPMSGEAPMSDEAPDPAGKLSLPTGSPSFGAGPADGAAAGSSVGAAPVDPAELLLTPDDLIAAGKFPKSPFGAETTVDQGPLAYTVFDTAKPAKCSPMVSGPFAGTVPSSSGTIVASAQRLFMEGEPGTYIGEPVMIIQILQIFEDAASAASAFADIAAAAPGCRSYSYDDGYGIIERSWKEIIVTGSGGGQADANTIVMLDRRLGRAIGLDANAVWGISVTSGRAMEKDEIGRLGDLVELTRERLAGQGLG